MNFIKTNFVGLIAIVVCIILFFNRNPFGCNTPAPQPTTVTTTTKDSNTTQIPQPPVTVPIYIPIPSSTQDRIVIPQQYQGSSNYEALLKQYNELATKFLTQRNYTDSVQLKDSLGNRVGVFKNNDIVAENEIKTRNPTYQLSFPKTVVNTTTTTTITLPYIPKNKFYVLGEISGSITQPVNGAHTGILWQNKKDQLYYGKVGVQYYTGTIQPQFSIGTAWKIKLGK